MTPLLPARLVGSVALPTSKSISARALVINALSAEPCRLHGLSPSDDTQAVAAALRDNPEVVDVGAAGTAMRFLTAYYATRSGETHTLVGTERMHRRPIGILVDALRRLDADVEYLGEEGYPPLRIRGRRLKGGVVSMNAGVSSQYLSALLMIAPTLEGGLTLRLEGKCTSAPYLRMTLALMGAFGVCGEWRGAEVSVPQASYRRAAPYCVEGDWSAASYWYAMAALCPDVECRLRLQGLTLESVQGDSVCAELFRPLGIVTNPLDDGVLLTKTSARPSTMEVDFSDCPDLAQTLVVVCAMLGVSFRFTGLHTLRIKETDRMAALQTELQKLGVQLHAPDGTTLTFSPSADRPSPPADLSVSIDTYEDHRMAMAFAPAAYCFPYLDIRHPEVVTKSYPDFWTDLARQSQQY